jgi:hypothetical protein
VSSRVEPPPSLSWFEPREPTQDERRESTPAYARPSLLPSPEPTKCELLPSPARFELQQQPETKRETPRHLLETAIAKQLRTGELPGTGGTVSWDRFCDSVREDCDGWKDRRKRKPKRGYGDRTIKRLVAIQRAPPLTP